MTRAGGHRLPEASTALSGLQLSYNELVQQHLSGRVSIPEADVQMMLTLCDQIRTILTDRHPTEHGTPRTLGGAPR